MVEQVIPQVEQAARVPAPLREPAALRRLIDGWSQSHNRRPHTAASDEGTPPRHTLQWPDLYGNTGSSQPLRLRLRLRLRLPSLLLLLLLLLPPRKANRASQAGWEKGGPRV